MSVWRRSSRAACCFIGITSSWALRCVSNFSYPKLLKCLHSLLRQYPGTIICCLAPCCNKNRCQNMSECLAKFGGRLLALSFTRSCTRSPDRSSVRTLSAAYFVHWFSLEDLSLLDAATSFCSFSFSSTFV